MTPFHTKPSDWHTAGDPSKPMPYSTLTVSTYFDAAHRMCNGTQPEYLRWHGHRYEVSVTMTLRRAGWRVADLQQLRDLLEAQTGMLDHRPLLWTGDPDIPDELKENGVIFDEPVTMEMIAMHLGKALDAATMNAGLEARVERVRVSSQPDAYAEYVL